ncbi:glycosyltransferase [Haloarcula amylolytica]|uniref:glycosyltransferase n=1 Tax=Haloarcula amylolytica TaxID=396317 RepID=UPI003C72E9CD
MAKIGIYHPDVERGGGAEAVCLHMIDALCSVHDVTLLTASRPDFTTLDDHYMTNTRGTDVQLLGTIAEKLADGMSMYKIRHAVFARAVRKRSENYDGIISAFNELTVPGGALQYVHHPLYRCLSSPEEEKELFGCTRDIVAKKIAGLELGCGPMLTNSEWMASILESCWGIKPSVVYPPVKAGESAGKKWTERENGFVAVGRIAPDKRTGLAIDIVKQLNQKGNDLTLHLIGQPDGSEYALEVQNRAKELNFVEFHGEVSRDRLISLLNSVRYGLHTKKHEHFGMAVAEMVASGMIPFVPNSGGQVEIVGRETALTYSSPKEAINIIEEVIRSQARQEELLRSLPDPKSRYGPERFTTEIQSQVDTWLNTKTR